MSQLRLRDTMEIHTPESVPPRSERATPQATAARGPAPGPLYGSGF